MTEATEWGRIEISPMAVATLASQAILNCYGVVGLASPSLCHGIVELLQREHRHRGVEVRMVDDQIIIDLYVIIEYGTRISEVAQNIMRNVKFRVEKSLGVPVAQVNVHVQGLRVSD